MKYSQPENTLNQRSQEKVSYHEPSECGAEVQVERHLDLDSEISNQNEIVDQLERLLIRIAGNFPTDVPDCKATANQGPTLSDVLSYGSDRLRQTREQARNLINQIELNLF